MAKPRVFVSSTYYDLKHIRNSLEAFIESLGYEPILFESGDIPFRHDVPLDESCYSEIQNCHMLVLIVGGRYGSAASAEPSAPAGDPEEKAYQFYNSITRREYEAARKRDIPIFIFVEKNVLAEFRTFKANRTNKTVKYVHVDSVNVFNLLDDILIQRRNNYLKEFEHFEDISIWLRDQWAGLFADQMARRGREVAIQDLADQVESLTQLSGVLKEYTESIMRKVEPEESKQIISTQKKFLRASKLKAFEKEDLVQFLMMIHEGLTPSKLLSALGNSTSLEDFLSKAGFSNEEVTDFIAKHGPMAMRDHERLLAAFVKNKGKLDEDE